MATKEGEQNIEVGSKAAQRCGWKRTSEWRVGVVIPWEDSGVDWGIFDGRRKVEMYEFRQLPCHFNSLPCDFCITASCVNTFMIALGVRTYGDVDSLPDSLD